MITSLEISSSDVNEHFLPLHNLFRIIPKTKILISSIRVYISLYGSEVDSLKRERDFYLFNRDEAILDGRKRGDRKKCMYCEKHFNTQNVITSMLTENRSVALLNLVTLRLNKLIDILIP